MTISKRDPAALAATMQAWLERRIPDGRIVLGPISEASGGHSSETLFISAEIARGGAVEQARWVLRIEATGHQVYQDPSVARQAWVMQAVARSGLAPVPRVLWIEEDSAVLGAPFFIMERVDGEAGDEHYHSRGVLFDAPEAERAAMWLSAVEAMAGVHRVDPAEAGFLARPALGPTGLDQEIAAWDNYCLWAAVKPNATLERARAWLTRNLPSHRPTGLAWGDARLGNVMFRDGRCCALLDWETASLGGAETDLGWWIYYDWWIAEGMNTPRLAGIGGREETIRAWEHFAGRKAEAMEWHEVFATWRFAIISERAVDLANLQGGGLPILGGDSNPAVARLKDLI